MALYNNLFRMKDFFLNPRLDNIFPQFTKEEAQLPHSNILNEEVIGKKISAYLAGAVQGIQNGLSVKVEGKPYDAVLGQIRALQSVIEGFFSNSKPIVKNVANPARLYTTVSSERQLADITLATDKLRYMNEVLQNLAFNPDFGTEQDRRKVALTGLYKPFGIEEREWQQRVQYKPVHYATKRKW